MKHAPHPKRHSTHADEERKINESALWHGQTVMSLCMLLQVVAYRAPTPTIRAPVGELVPRVGPQAYWRG